MCKIYMMRKILFLKNYCLLSHIRCEILLFFLFIFPISQYELSMQTLNELLIGKNMHIQVEKNRYFALYVKFMKNIILL